MISLEDYGRRSKGRSTKKSTSLEEGCLREAGELSQQIQCRTSDSEFD